ncbi:MAG: hypothetical protein C7B47_15040 [Sulfobacillus thermosulfidooxidans]|uniref:Uncharacterized protein n=1 Tax=Sulfobacillus thermosulfidooxidans TaxID=28034 RepID=A0A2T2WPZ7_SULTH|nr:MAG: hypothetical protein C7B47_15040 [Sulfobacillus thermosulfidooxidans]
MSENPFEEFDKNPGNNSLTHRPLTSCATMLEAVKAFHDRNQFIVGTGTREDLLLRLALLQGELGELAETVTKSSKGSQHGFSPSDWTAMQNEWGDVLYLLIGWAVELGWNADTIAEIFQRTHQKNLSRAPRHTALARTAPEPPTTGISGDTHRIGPLTRGLLFLSLTKKTQNAIKKMIINDSKCHIKTARVGYTRTGPVQLYESGALDFQAFGTRTFPA